MGTLIIIVLLIVIIGLLSAKYIPYLIALAILYSIFGKATLGVIVISGILYLRHLINKGDDQKQQN